MCTIIWMKSVKIGILHLMMQKSTFLRLIILFFAHVGLNLGAQNAREVAVEVQATLTSNNKLQLSWLTQKNTVSYDVYSKKSDNKGWDLLATLKDTVLKFVDTSYKLGTKKEYRVARTSTSYTGFTGNGYILAGFDIAAKSNLGKVLVLIDENYKTVLNSDIKEYLHTLTSEGWNLDTHYVARNAKVSDVKNWIFSKWQADSVNIKSIFLLGHVPVPYSGNFGPDGHSEHTGAWPADVYYGNFSANWSDNTVNNSSASRSENKNVPGDGKFDVSRINPTNTPANAIKYTQIPVGRVDLFNMPAFGNDTFLIKRYLQKAIKFRTAQYVPENRALIDDNFGYFNSEAFSSGGFRNYAPFVGDKIFELDFRTEMNKNSYLLAYACGSGTYTSAGGVGSSADFVNDSLLNPFSMMFGSYFGDWDNQNNYLRAPLASKGWGLASAWSGRPYWMVHESALGEPLSKSVLTTMNSYNVYNAAAFQSGAHAALMGDPTLRMYNVEKLMNLRVANNCDLSFTASWDNDTTAFDSLVFEKWVGKGWEILETAKGAVNNYTINDLFGLHRYSVRPLKKMKSASGTWWQYGLRDTFSVFLDESPEGYISGPILKQYCLNETYEFIDSNKDKSGETYLWKITKGNLVDSFVSGDGVTYSIKYDVEAKQKMELIRTSVGGCVFIDSFTMNFVKTGSTHLLFPQGKEFCENANVYVQYSQDFIISEDAYWELSSTGQKIIGQEPLTTNMLNSGMQKIELFAIDSVGCENYLVDSLFIKPAPDKPIISTINYDAKSGVKLKIDNPSLKTIWNNDDSQNDTIFQFVYEPGLDTVVRIFVNTVNEDGCVSDSTEVRFGFNSNRIKTILANPLSVFPNPTKGKLFINIPNGVSDARIYMYSTTGQMVKEQSIENKPQVELDLSLPAGVYFILLVGDNYQSGAQIVIE